MSLYHCKVAYFTFSECEMILFSASNRGRRSGAESSAPLCSDPASATCRLLQAWADLRSEPPDLRLEVELKRVLTCIRFLGLTYIYQKTSGLRVAIYLLTVWEVRNPKVKVSAGLCSLWRLWGRILLPLSSSSVCQQSLAFLGLWHRNSNLCLLPPCVSESLSS